MIDELRNNYIESRDQLNKPLKVKIENLSEPEETKSIIKFEQCTDQYINALEVQTDVQVYSTESDAVMEMLRIQFFLNWKTNPLAAMKKFSKGIDNFLKL